MELRKLSIGKTAPEIEGYDLNDHPMKLSNYRGKVVVLLFWSEGNNGPKENDPAYWDTLEGGRLAEQFEGKPFALIGIARGRSEKIRMAAEKYDVRWPSFQDAPLHDPPPDQDSRYGPIYNAYNVRGWPTYIVLDRKGIIRSRGLVHRTEIAKAVQKLLTD